MFNRELYEQVERESGFRKKFIAEKMGIGYSRYLSVTTGVAPWKLNEIESVVSILDIKRKVRDQIFFDGKRHNMRTSPVETTEETV